MSGTGIKCIKCGRIFRQIHGSSTKEIHNVLNEDEKKRFFGDDFFCCGKEHLKSLRELGMMDDLMSLQTEWLSVNVKVLEGRGL